MNCSEWEERIALGEPADDVERHLAECAGCREFSAGLRESLAWLKEAHADEPAAAHFAAVRARVMGELERRRVPVWRRAWVYGLAAAGLAVAVVVGMRMNERPRLEPPVAVVQRPASPEAPAVERASTAPIGRPLAHARGRVRRPARVAKQVKTEPLMIKIETDNPDVVLYWIAEKRGDD